MNYKIKFEENPSFDDIQILGNGIDQFSQSRVARSEKKQLTFFLQDEVGLIVGGIHGNYTSYGWLYIQALWVSDSVRDGGFGTKLMNSIEQKAFEAGCTSSYLDTFSFQAPEFYKRLGYSVFGELKDFPPGHSRIFLSKKLIATQNS